MVLNIKLNKYCLFALIINVIIYLAQTQILLSRHSSILSETGIFVLLLDGAKEPVIRFLDPFHNAMACCRVSACVFSYRIWNQMQSVHVYGLVRMLPHPMAIYAIKCMCTDQESIYLNYNSKRIQMLTV